MTKHKRAQMKSILERRDGTSLDHFKLSGVGDEAGASLEERVADELAEHVTRFGSYEGIRDYKARFGAEWEDPFLIYEGRPFGLARTAVALAHATDRGNR